MNTGIRLWLTILVSLAAGVPGSTAETRHSLLADYQSLQEWTFTSSPVEIEAAGLDWQVDVANWHLDQGRIWIQRPISSGRVTGLVFEGSGRYTIAVPDPVELHQLRRFTLQPELEQLEGFFDALVVRGVNMPPLDRVPEAWTTSSYSASSLANRRHQHWLALRGFDVDARLVAALGSPDDAYLRVDMKTREHGWLTFDYDARRAEEIVVEWFNPSFSVLESWISLDREADRLPSGRPSAEPNPSLDIRHVDITADLTSFASESQRGAARIRPVDAKIEATIAFEPLGEGDRTVQLFLHPWAKVETIRDQDSNELAWIRDHLGKRSSAIRKQVHDDSLVVLLDRPLKRGELETLTVIYELELTGYAPGRSWYPSSTYPGSGLIDLHTASLTVHQRPNFAAKSMGSVVRENTVGGLSTTQWQLSEPVKMLTLVFAKQYHEELFNVGAANEVSAFSSLGGFITRKRVRELGEDAVQILGFYEELFDAPPDTSTLIVGLVPASHGQAFEGLIHIGDYSTLTDRVAERELFRAHEIAHLWWGHQVGWHGYRDQWLSEGFSQYSAMMFVEANLSKGEEYFQEMLAAFTNELTGSIQSGFSQFSQPDVSLLNKRATDRIGPIGHGQRCRVGEAPTAYRSQSYKRGALALHSLRMLLRARTGSDDTFITILREFLSTYRGGFPSTADFQATVERLTQQDWTWFFDTWIYRAEIPTYTWSYTLASLDGSWKLNIEIQQSHSATGAAMEIPIQIALNDGSEQVLLAFLDQPHKSFEFPLVAEPKQVILNPDHAVLARVKKK